jgi:hypothetical protein
MLCLASAEGEEWERSLAEFMLSASIEHRNIETFAVGAARLMISRMMSASNKSGNE